MIWLIEVDTTSPLIVSLRCHSIVELSYLRRVRIIDCEFFDSMITIALEFRSILDESSCIDNNIFLSTEIHGLSGEESLCICPKQYRSASLLHRKDVATIEICVASSLHTEHIPEL